MTGGIPMAGSDSTLPPLLTVGRFHGGQTECTSSRTAGGMSIGTKVGGRCFQGVLEVVQADRDVPTAAGLGAGPEQHLVPTHFHVEPGLGPVTGGLAPDRRAPGG